jgi:nucleoside-diphosphate-sugar epimerase
MHIFVTGGSGFVGSHLIEALSPHHTVSAMARSERSAAAVSAYGARPVRCSLADVAAPHLEGCDAVVHAAAFVEEWGTRAQFVEGNVTGTRRMLDAARAAGVPTFVHIGTEAALFDGRPLVDIDETAPTPARHRFLYSETKAEAERLVLAAEGLRAISLRPRLVWGPRDASVLPAMLRMVDTGRFAWVGGGNALTSTTHVLNLVHGVRLALERGRPGQAYFLSDGHDTTLRAFLGALIASQGREVPDRSLPAWLARSAAAVLEVVARLTGRPPQLTRFAAAMMSSTVTVRIDKARAELGYEPVVTVEEGLAALRAGAKDPAGT